MTGRLNGSAACCVPVGEKHISSRIDDWPVVAVTGLSPTIAVLFSAANKASVDFVRASEVSPTRYCVVR